MIFIEFEELKVRKFPSLYEDVSDENNYIIEELESEAIEYIKTFLKGRYDTDYIFSRTGSDRNALIKYMTIDYIMCHLWMRTNSNEIPESLQNKCESNKEFLMEVSKGTISPDLPTLDSDLQDTVRFKGGSESVFNDTDHIS